MVELTKTNLIICSRILLLLFLSSCMAPSMQNVKKTWKESSYSNAQVCEFINIGNNWKNEAIKRGITCNDEKPNTTNTQIISKDTKIQRLKSYGYYFTNQQLAHRFADWSDNDLCFKAFINGSWSNSDEHYPMIQEAKRRNLNCNLVKDNNVNKKYTIKTEVKRHKNNQDKKNNFVKLENTLSTCKKLQNKVLAHIDNDEYQKASAARKLMKEMNCSSSSNTTSNSQSYTAPKNISKYSSSELSCSVGPLGKFMFREFGRYNVKAFDDNPPKACNQTYEYCKARARAIAKGARIPSSERSPNSYSADCNITGTNRFNTTADCTVTPDRSGGGFAGGLANELGKGIERTAAMKRVYVSSFERCMTEMGYSVSGR